MSRLARVVHTSLPRHTREGGRTDHPPTLRWIGTCVHGRAAPASMAARRVRRRGTTRAWAEIRCLSPLASSGQVEARLPAERVVVEDAAVHLDRLGQLALPPRAPRLLQPQLLRARRR